MEANIVSPTSKTAKQLLFALTAVSLVFMIVHYRVQIQLANLKIDEMKNSNN